MGTPFSAMIARPVWTRPRLVPAFRMHNYPQDWGIRVGTGTWICKEGCGAATEFMIVAGDHGGGKPAC